MTITIKHRNTGKHLHSHGVKYSSGSRQQEVTGYGGRDSNDLFRIRHKNGNKQDFSNGDIIYITHKNTRKNLHSHNVRSPVTHQQEVSAYGNNGKGDSNDYWRVILPRGHIITQGTNFRLQHVNTGKFLHSHRANLRTGSRQQEVTAYKRRDSNDYWFVSEITAVPRKPVPTKYVPIKPVPSRPVTVPNNNNNGTAKIIYDGGVFRFKGKCITIKLDLITKYIPKYFQAPWEVLKSIIEVVLPEGPTGCIGDFTGKQLGTNTLLQKTLCDKIPYDPLRTFSLMSYHVPGLPCGLPVKGKPSDVDATTCITYDKFGSFAVSMNLGTIMCIASVTAGAASLGIIPLIATFSDVVENIGIGFSLKRVYVQKLKNLPYNNGGTIEFKDVTLKGSVFFNLGIQIPTDFMKIGKYDIGKYFGLSASFQYMIDFGNVGGIVKGVINDLKNVNKNTAKSVVNKIIKLGSEISLVIDGNLTVKLKDLTKEILPNFSFALGNVSALLTRGNGYTGMKGGFYISLSSNSAANLLDSIQGIFELFEPVLSRMGIKKIKIPNIGVSLKLFINGDALGFYVNFYSMTVKCIFKYRGSKFSCQFNLDIFTMLKDAAEFIFKKAKALFDETGKVITKIKKAAFRATSKVIGKSIKALSIAAEKTRKFAIKHAKKVLETAKKAAKKAKQLAKAAARKAKKIAQAAVRKAKKIAQAAARKAKEVARKAKQVAEAAARKAKQIAEAAARKAKQVWNAAQLRAKLIWCGTRYWYSGSKRNRCKRDARNRYR
jgi:hypothetical protein